MWHCLNPFKLAQVRHIESPLGNFFNLHGIIFTAKMNIVPLGKFLCTSSCSNVQWQTASFI